MNNTSVKKIAYYVVAVVSFFFLAWAAADILSVGFNFALLSSGGGAPPKMRGGMMTPGNMGDIDMSYDSIYRQMVLDRLGDSGARLLVSGIIFFAIRRRIRRLEATS